GGRSEGNQAGMITDGNYVVTMDEKPAKLVFWLVERGEPERLLTFRLTDIPLPTSPAVAAPRRVAPPPPLPAPPGGDHPYFERGGGTLVSRVQFGEKAAAGGELSIGLAAKSGGGWSPIRWTKVEVDAQGVARLGDLKPGTYRLLRSYRAKAGEAPSG